MIEISNLGDDSEKFYEYVRRANHAHQNAMLGRLMRNTKKALAINPNYTKGWLDLGLAYRLKNKPHKALDCYNHVPVGDPYYNDMIYSRTCANEELLGLLSKKKKKYRNDIIEISIIITPLYIALIGLIVLQVFFSDLIAYIELLYPPIRGFIFTGIFFFLVPLTSIITLMLANSIRKFVSTKNKSANIKYKLFQSNLSM